MSRWLPGTITAIWVILGARASFDQLLVVLRATPIPPWRDAAADAVR